MQCPSCKASQPMSFRCRSCGVELVRRVASRSRHAQSAGAAAVAVAMDGPMDMPSVARPAVVRAHSGGALASRGARLAAVLIDGLLVLASMVPGVVLAGGMEGSPEAMMQTGALGIVVGPILLGLYYMFILARDGQTLGKKAMKLRIVNYQDGGNPGFGRVVALRIWANSLLSVIPFYSLVDLLFIFGSQQRCLHDLIAKTKVVQA